MSLSEGRCRRVRGRSSLTAAHEPVTGKPKGHEMPIRGGEWCGDEGPQRRIAGAATYAGAAAGREDGKGGPSAPPADHG